MAKVVKWKEMLRDANFKAPKEHNLTSLIKWRKKKSPPWLSPQQSGCLGKTEERWLGLLWLVPALSSRLSIWPCMGKPQGRRAVAWVGGIWWNLPGSITHLHPEGQVLEVYATLGAMARGSHLPHDARNLCNKAPGAPLKVRVRQDHSAL